MSERESILPYDTTYVKEWAIQHGVDADQYESYRVSHGGFLIAKLRSKELTQEFLFLRDIEASLGLENCKLVPNPRQKANEPELPKVYSAPEGMAFEITTSIPDDEWIPIYDDAEDGFIGKYLEIDDLYILGDGTRRANIVVREEPKAYATPVEDWGENFTWVHGPGEKDFIRLPSRADPTKDGARIWIPMPAGVEINFAGNKVRAPYESSSIKLVPYEEKQSTELYIANFTQSDQPALDDFIFIDETLTLPRGVVSVPKRGGGERYIPNRIGQLVLPPMTDREVWNDLWDNHGIMIKWNPTIHQDRFVRLDYRYGQSSVEYQVRKFNSGQANGRMFMRALAVSGFAGVADYTVVMKTALSKERLSLEELLKEEERY